ncbi:hypothetical protein E2C01_001332 [Portunus trituberculatus]|uniref:Uncharacterized protein n=1 Tax=Portunus trituberculatus TaxID=210409 RepID=A0A5B7CH13_PORTR|nr:hypothetical protein [Portunus trituberculatus]
MFGPNGRRASVKQKWACENVVSGAERIACWREAILGRFRAWGIAQDLTKQSLKGTEERREKDKREPVFGIVLVYLRNP